jgi:NhaA family Na+:H+ antiporter
MGVFFFVVGLEIKRELLQGELADRRRAMFPVAAALGGMVIPAAIYAALNAGSLGARGWGIPMATDIAFALGVLALLGDRIPSSLRVFLLALAIVDDLGAILVIAVFYTEQISWLALGAALLVLLLVFAMRLVGVVSVYLYILVGAMLWLAVLKSGVHATVAGVLLGAATPAQPYLTRRTFADSAQSLLTRFRKAMQAEEYETADAALGELEDVIEATESPLDRLLRVVHPWSSYLVLPVFALANSGVEVSPETAARALNSAVTLGVGAGLILGKPIGILLFAWIAVRLAVADPLAGVNWKQLAGAGLLAGIGFTVSIFIASLSFEGTALLSEAKMGVLAGSLLAGVGGFLCLRLASTPAPRG